MDTRLENLKLRFNMLVCDLGDVYLSRTLKQYNIYDKKCAILFNDFNEYFATGGSTQACHYIWEKLKLLRSGNQEFSNDEELQEKINFQITEEFRRIVNPVQNNASMEDTLEHVFDRFHALVCSFGDIFLIFRRSANGIVAEQKRIDALWDYIQKCKDLDNDVMIHVHNIPSIDLMVQQTLNLQFRVNTWFLYLTE